MAEGGLVTRVKTLALVAVCASVAFYLVVSSELAGFNPASAGNRDVANGESLYEEYCASCHGTNLEGQPEWQSPGPDGRLPAPPHDETGHTWHHPDSLLFDYTKLGGQQALSKIGVELDSGMPGFGDQLSDDDINDILAFIKSTWPERIREIQAERTKLDQ